MRINWRLFLQFLISIAIIVFLLSRLDLGQVWSILSIANYWLVASAVGLHILSLSITGYGLKALFDSIKHIGFIEFMKYFLIGISLGLVLPGRAGDLSIIYLVKKKGFEYGESTALTLIDKITTLIVFGAIAAIGLFTIFNSNELELGLTMVAIIALGGIVAFSSIGRAVLRKLFGKYAALFKGFNKTFRNLLQKGKKKILINLAITAIRPVITGLLFMLLFYSIGIKVSLWHAIVINAIAFIASLLPLTPSGIGIREGTGIFLFSQIGVPLEASASVYAIALTMNILTGVFGVMPYLSETKKEVTLKT